MTTTPKPYDVDFNELVGTGIYRDTGCELSPSCLDCGMEVCRYDTQFGIQQLQNQERDRAIRASERQGVHPQALADRWGISLRTVYRIVSGR